MYGYFARRCGDRGTAEDLTSETFLAAMDAARKETPPPMTVPWLIGVARHKLADHYRRRHDRFSVPVAELPEPVDPADDWDAELDRIVAERCSPGCPNSTAPCWRCATWTTARCPSAPS